MTGEKNNSVYKDKVLSVIGLIVFALLFIFSCLSKTLTIGNKLIGTFGAFTYALFAFLTIVCLLQFLGFEYKRSLRATILFSAFIICLLFIIHSIKTYAILEAVASKQAFVDYINYSYSNLTLLGSFGSIIAGALSIFLGGVGTIIVFIITGTIFIAMFIDFELYGKYEEKHIKKLKTRKLRKIVMQSDSDTDKNGAPKFSFSDADKKYSESDVVAEISADDDSISSFEKKSKYTDSDVLDETSDDKIYEDNSVNISGKTSVYDNYNNQNSDEQINYWSGIKSSSNSGHYADSQNNNKNVFGRDAVDTDFSNDVYSQPDYPDVYDENEQRRQFMKSTFASVDSDAVEFSPYNYGNLTQNNTQHQDNSRSNQASSNNFDNKTSQSYANNFSSNSNSYGETSGSSTPYYNQDSSDFGDDYGYLFNFPDSAPYIPASERMNGINDSGETESNETNSDDTQKDALSAFPEVETNSNADGTEDSNDRPLNVEDKINSIMQKVDDDYTTISNSNDFSSSQPAFNYKPNLNESSDEKSISSNLDFLTESINEKFDNDLNSGNSFDENYKTDETEEQEGSFFSDSNDSYSSNSGFGGGFRDDYRNQNEINLNDEIDEQEKNTPIINFDLSEDAKPKIPSQKSNKPLYKGNAKYNAPPLTLLKEIEPDNGDYEEEQTKKAKGIENVLNSFKIGVTVANIIRGPKITRYEVSVPLGIQVKKISSYELDIQKALAAKSINMLVPIPGSEFVGIELENDKFTSVGLRELFESDAFKNCASPLPIAIGKNISGEIIVKGLTKMVHMLVAGQTGSGKSVFVHSIILSLIYRNSPDDLKIMLIDPKKVEFGRYNGLPHLITPKVVLGNKNSVSALNWCVNEMDRRYDLMSKAGYSFIGTYNNSEIVKSGQMPKFPYIVIVVDEYAELVTENKKDTEMYIQRITQLSRACGMYLVLATQRPSVDVISGVIKNNIPTRVALSLASQNDSKTILNSMGGAEKLLGNGDLLFADNGTSVVERLQGGYCSEDEINSIVKYVIDNNESNFDETVEQAIEQTTSSKANDGSSNGDAPQGKELDEYLKDALKMFIQRGVASGSHIQRKFQVGYSRAARIMDQLEEKGYIAPANGSKVRKVLITPEEFKIEFGEDVDSGNGGY